ncbi:hypothetical protein CJU89_1266 [Yarrowia sp. B02]|nr:hypothetical protein CJU89_1266 [Yarrowia sp. B02]
MHSLKRLRPVLPRANTLTQLNLGRCTRHSHFLTSDTQPSYRTRLSPLSPIKEILYSDVHSLLELKMVTVDIESVRYVQDFIGPKYQLPEAVIRELLCISHTLTPSAQQGKPFQEQTASIEDTLGYGSINSRVLLGQHAYKFAVFSYLTKVPSWSRKKANLMNFDICRSGLADRLSRDETLVLAFVKNTNLIKSLYVPLPDEGERVRRGQAFKKMHNTHLATKMLFALISSIQIEHGGDKAEQFVHEVILEGYMTSGLLNLV